MQEDDDIEDHKVIPARLQRGFSKTSNNIKLVGLARDFMFKGVDDEDEDFFAEKTEFTFALPDLMTHPEDFKAFLFKELVESSMLVSLEQEGHLNWWTDLGVCDRLLPMVTCGDGNCLLHAASLSMWGFHDRVLALRRALNTVMLKSRHLDSFKRRWRHQQSLFLKACDLILDEAEWRKEWDLLVEVTSLEPRNASRIDSYGGKKQSGGGSLSTYQSSAIYESLEEFHVFILCHIIKRPIIVMANPFLKNSQGENFSPVPFRGIYLPLERDPKECCTSPLLLAYNLGHFCALAAMQNDGSASHMTLNVPLVDSQMNLLPIHFIVDPVVNPGKEIHVPSQEDKLYILQKYLDVKLVGATNLGRRTDDLLVDLRDHVMVTQKDKVQSGFNTFQRRRSSLQSTNYFRPLSSDTPGTNGKNILCAKLIVKKTPFANELVKNYLRDVQMRFEGMTRQKVGQLEEIRRRSRDGIQLRHVVRSPSSSSSHSGKLLNIFRSNNGKTDSVNKSTAGGTLPSKISGPQMENQKLLRSPGNLISNNATKVRKSAPIGYFDKHPEIVEMPSGLMATSGTDKKESYGAVKTIQKLLGQNKVKSEKSTFYKTKPDTMVVEGKSKFYATLYDIDCGKKEDSSSRDVPSVGSGVFKLPRIFKKNSPPSSPSNSVQYSDETNFSTFPSRSSLAKHASKFGGDENTASLPKIKSKVRTTNQDWKKDLGFNSSTSDPNIFEINKQNDIRITDKFQSILPCITDGCTFFGSKDKIGYCSVCYAERGLEEQPVGHLRGNLKAGNFPSAIRGNRSNTEYLVDQYGYPFCQTKL